jgi:hypothetical protein
MSRGPAPIKLDIDLAVESIEHPERFPLLSKVEMGEYKRAKE